MRDIERWGTVAGYSRYQISDRGRVRNIGTGKFLKVAQDKRGNAPQVVLRSDDHKRHKTVMVNRLVARLYMENYIPGRVVKFRDGDKSNCHISNLYQTPPSHWTAQYEDRALREVPTFRFSKIPGHTCLLGETNTCWE